MRKHMLVIVALVLSISTMHALPRVGGEGGVLALGSAMLGEMPYVGINTSIDINSVTLDVNVGAFFFSRVEGAAFEGTQVSRVGAFTSLAVVFPIQLVATVFLLPGVKALVAFPFISMQDYTPYLLVPLVIGVDAHINQWSIRPYIELSPISFANGKFETIADLLPSMCGGIRISYQL